MGQKPVPFVPSLDENFEYWFKKDSLWQSEDLEAVVGQDVGRTCILQGPMAAKYSTIVNEPIKKILDGVHNAHIASLTKDLYNGDQAAIPVIEYFGGRKLTAAGDVEEVDGLTISSEANKVTYRLSSSPSQGALPDADSWLKLLAGNKRSWRHAVFTTAVFVQGNKYQDNPMKRIFSPAHGMLVEITDVDDREKTVITVKEQHQGSGRYVKTMEVKMTAKKEISLSCMRSELPSESRLIAHFA